MRYRLKLTIIISVLVALAFGIGGTGMIITSFQASLDKEYQAALDSFGTIQSTLDLLNSLGTQTGHADLVTALTQMEAQHIGTWQALRLYTQEAMIYRSGDAQLLQYTLPLPKAQQCTTLPVSDTYGYGLLILGSLDGGGETLQLLARFDLSGVYETRWVQQRLYLAVYAAVVVFGAVSAALLSNALTRRLRRLTVTVRQISGGDLSKRSKIHSSDEVGQLSRDFDVMADKLQENISRLETDMQRQESFMGAFAHELKTPMTSIIGFADLLRQGNLDENTRAMAAEYIHSEAHRLERLSFKLLELLLLNKDGITMKRRWLSGYIAEVERALSPVLKSKGIRLVCRGEQARVAFEPDLVKSLLYNLIDNASKAMDAEGIIAVNATVIPGGCQIQIADNGRGMEPSELSRITEAFYRVDKARSRSQGGAGLGLALCRQIAELHNGSIRFASEPGKGTRVTVTLYGKAGKTDA